ncbi:hypothetical protein BKA80DRAFT_269584 [Phyllosticta citrichinensis]
MRQMRDPWTRSEYQKMTKMRLAEKLRTFRSVPPKPKPIQENFRDNPDLSLHMMRPVMDLTAGTSHPATPEQAQSIAVASGSSGQKESPQVDVDDPDPSPKIADWMLDWSIHRLKDRVWTRRAKRFTAATERDHNQEQATMAEGGDGVKSTGKGGEPAGETRKTEGRKSRGIIEWVAKSISAREEKERKKSQGNTVSPRSSVPDSGLPPLPPELRMTPIKTPAGEPALFSDPFRKKSGQAGGASTSTDQGGGTGESDGEAHAGSSDDAGEVYRTPGQTFHVPTRLMCSTLKMWESRVLRMWSTLRMCQRKSRRSPK